MFLCVCKMTIAHAHQSGRGLKPISGWTNQAPSTLRPLIRAGEDRNVCVSALPEFFGYCARSSERARIETHESESLSRRDDIAPAHQSGRGLKRFQPIYMVM